MERYRGSLLEEIICTSSDATLTRYYAYISGEHVGLAKAELESLCRLLPYDVSVAWEQRLARIDCIENPVDFLLGRAALVQEAGTVISEADTLWALSEQTRETAVKRHLSDYQSFAVRALSLEGKAPQEDKSGIEREVGNAIRRNTMARVNLRAPDVLLRVFITSRGLLLCRSTSSPLRPILRTREPGRKTFFHPSMMNATLSRAMCNLAGLLPGYTVLDPFCGGGGILCEAAHIGAKPVGVDLNWKLLRGAHRNLAGIAADFGLLQGDARHPPVALCDYLVTDPPYGRASSTRGAEARDLLYQLVGKLDDLIKSRGERVCICASQTMDLQRAITEAGFLVGTSVEIAVHSGLVREVVTVLL
jgi:tRNA (guanine10-N2)-dimethyltransferase